MNILLASSSPYRKELLERLKLPFQQQSPDIDERPHAKESAQQLATRLSKEKAQALAAEHPDTLIIASDQAAALGNEILGKPITRNNAISQLSRCSGNKVTFYTGLCLLNTATGQQQVDCIEFVVWFRRLTPEHIANYIDLESPLDCAGSFKCEGLGVTLFEKMSGNDPNSLVGLPLIALTSMLIKAGIHPLESTLK